MRDYIDKHGYKSLRSSPEFSNMAPPQLVAKVRNSITVENLAETDIIFSDKTGTLTKNEMKFSKLVDTSFKQIGDRLINEVQVFAIGLCNTVMTKVDDKAENRRASYQAESPDEIAFAEAAREHKLALVGRHAAKVFYDYEDAEGAISHIEYDILAVIPFSSSRKRMSIILQEVQSTGDSEMGYRTPEEIAAPGKAFVLTKGADSIMFPRIYYGRNDNVQSVEIDGKNNSEQLRA